MNQHVQITGSDLLEDLLYSFGVRHIFCISGAGNLAIIDSIEKRGRIVIVYSHHEQAAVMEAQGYSRTSGFPGVALVTTGGGTSNALTGILSAHLDSIPILTISGNESLQNINRMSRLRAYGVQGFDSVAVLGSVCKSSQRITKVTEVRAVMEDAWREMSHLRPGPVHVDFPMDLQRQIVEPVPSNKAGEEAVFQSGVKLIDRPSLHTSKSMDHVIELLHSSRRPLIYFGNGVRNSAAIKQLSCWLTDNYLPYLVSWSALDLFPSSDSLNVGRVGIYGDRAANILLQQCDLLVCVGTRLAIPQVGYDLADFGRKAKRFVVDIDSTELSKFSSKDWTTIQADAGEFLEIVMDRVHREKSTVESWLERIRYVQHQTPQESQIGPDFSDVPGVVHSFKVVESINRHLPKNSVVVTDVGAGLLTGHFAIKVDGSQRVFTSQGLGEMGFGLPGAIGASIADRARTVICLNTDGGMMFNLQELEVARFHNLPIKLFVFNNNGYSMIRISQTNLFGGRLSGISPATGISFPQFSEIAKTFGFNYTKLSSSGEIDQVCSSAICSPSPELVEVVMSPDQKYFPRLSTSRDQNGNFISPPLEDMDPKIGLDALADLLGYEPHPNSNNATR